MMIIFGFGSSFADDFLDDHPPKNDVKSRSSTFGHVAWDLSVTPLGSNTMYLRRGGRVQRMILRVPSCAVLGAGSPSGLLVARCTRPGEPTKSDIENGPVEIVDFPIKNGDFPLLC